MSNQRTHEQLVASIVHIRINRAPSPSLLVEPDLVRAYYMHGGDDADPMRPHSVLWEVFGLLPGERIEIVASHLIGLATPHVPGIVLRRLFETSSTAPGGRAPGALAPGARTQPPYTWTIPYGASSVESVEFSMPTNEVGPITIKYDVRLFADDVLLALLDPGVHLTPDP